MGRYWSLQLAVLALVALPAAVAVPAAAYQTTGTSGASGVAVTVTRVGGQDRVTGGGTGGRPDCQVIGTHTQGAAGYEPVGLGPRPDDSTAYVASLICGGVFVRNVWVGEANTFDVDAEARRLAERWVGTVPVPDVSVGTAPPQRSITGFPTWFWVRGYAGEPVTDRLDAFGHPVDVRMLASEVAWDFGDGTNVTAGFGVAYPQESAVQHAYRVRSTSDQEPDGAYRLGLRFHLRPSYRVGGGAWQDLAPITVEHDQPIVVREIQAVITRQ